MHLLGMTFREGENQIDQIVDDLFHNSAKSIGG